MFQVKYQEWKDGKIGWTEWIDSQNFPSLNEARAYKRECQKINKENSQSSFFQYRIITLIEKVCR